MPFDTNSLDPSFGDEIPLFCGSVKKQFMAALLQSGVDVVLMTGAWGVLTDAQKKSASGVALANKFGLHAVACRHVVDTTGTLFGTRTGRGERSFSLEFHNVDDSVEREISVPASLGLAHTPIRQAPVAPGRRV